MDEDVRETGGPERFALSEIEAMLLAAFGLAEGGAPDIRWRIKQMQRHDWPDTVVTDRDLRKGYTPRQALRILAAAALLDAGYGPTEAITLARENENAALAIMATGVGGVDQAHRVHALHRPGAVGPASSRSSDPSPRQLTPVTSTELARTLWEEVRGRSAMVIDLAGMAGRAVRRLLGSDVTTPGFDTLLSEATHASARGDGFVPSDHPAGDRYLSPRRRDERRGGA